MPGGGPQTLFTFPFGAAPEPAWRGASPRGETADTQRRQRTWRGAGAGRWARTGADPLTPPDDIDVGVEEVTPGLAAAWEALVAESGAPSFLSASFLDVWRRDFAPGTPPRAIVARRDGAVVGVLPVTPGRLAGPPTHREAPVEGIVARDPAASRAVADALMGAGAPVVNFTFLPEEAPEYAVLEDAARRAGRSWSTRPSVTVPVVDTEGGWDAYWAGRSKNLRHNVKRCTRRAGEHGALESVVLDSLEGPALDAALDAGFAVEAAGWKGREGTALGLDPTIGPHYRAVAHWAAARGELRLFFINVEGTDIAFGLGVVSAGALYALKIGYAEDAGRLSPGLLLLHAMIQWTFGQSLARFDFAGHDAPYKATWATGYVHQLAVTSYSPGLEGRVRRAARAARSLAGRRSPR